MMKKHLFSWTKFWTSEIVSIAIAEADRTKIVLTFNTTKPFTKSNARSDAFTLGSAGGKTVSSYAVSASAKTVTLTCSAAFIYGDAPTVTFNPALKGATVSGKAVTNGILFDYIAPASLTATANSNTQITLAWTCASAREDGFSVEMSPVNESNYAEITVENANATGYVKTGLTKNTKYYFRVRSKRGTYYSAYCTSANATTQNT